MKKIEIVQHYSKDDEKCYRDYYSIDVKIGGKIVRHYGDHYHEKGLERSESFIEGYLFANGKDINYDDLRGVVKYCRKADDKI